MNGVPVTTLNTDVTPVTTGPLSIDVNGILTLAPNTPSGIYPITYTICEVDPATGLAVVPANCDTVSLSIVVFNVIDAVNDSIVTLPTGTTPVIVENVTANDTLNGVPVTATNTNVTPVTIGPLSVDATGILTLAANTPSGTYTITYSICEAVPSTGLNVTPPNCDTATAIVIVDNVIIATDDINPIAVNGYEGGIAISTVLTNDTLNGLAVSPSQVIITLTSVLPTGITFNTTTGQVGVTAGTPANVYTFTYDLCEVGAVPANCDSATVTVNVSAPPIVAEDDDFTTTPINGYDGGIVGNVFDNNGNGEDTLNNLPVLDVEITITLENDGGLTGVTIANDGTISVPAGTPAGTYFVEYQICDVLNPTNCDSAIVTIVVTQALIDAVDNDYTSEPVNSEIGGTYAIFDNDTLNGDPLIPSEVTFTVVDNGGLSGASISSGGNLIVPAGTPVGTYFVTYTICEVLNPNNCDTAVATIVVKDPCDFDDAPISCDLVVYNSISENNDGVNDNFIIAGIERYPNNTLCIFNRWGVLVYDADGYNNTTKVFKGYSDGRATIKQDSSLPEGTYFYVLKYNKSNGVTKEKAGYLYINRK